MRPALPLLLLGLSLTPALAEDAANRVDSAGAPGGPVARYVAAARLLPIGFAAEDPAEVLAAVRLAQSVTLRPAQGWTAAPEPPAEPDALRGLPRDPGGAEALTLLQMMVEGDPEAQLATAELLAVPAGPAVAAQAQRAGLAAGAVQRWTLPLYGEAPAELGLLDLTGAGLTLRVEDAGGGWICAAAAAEPAALCAFTPARNGWFTVEIANPGPDPAGYLLLSN